MIPCSATSDRDARRPQAIVLLGHDHIGFAHLLLSILSVGYRRGARALHSLGIDSLAVRKVIEQMALAE